MTSGAAVVKWLMVSSVWSQAFPGCQGIVDKEPTGLASVTVGLLVFLPVLQLRLLARLQGHHIVEVRM
jgi:hypothetical protein